MKLIKYKKYLYTWIDCMTEDTWTRASDLNIVLKSKLNQEFENIGYFVEENNGYYIFTTGLNKDGEDILHYFALTIIPKGQVIKIKSIK